MDLELLKWDRDVEAQNDAAKRNKLRVKRRNENDKSTTN